MSDTDSEDEKIVEEVRHSSSETSYDEEEVAELPKPEAKSESTGTLVSREYNISIATSLLIVAIIETAFKHSSHN